MQTWDIRSLDVQPHHPEVLHTDEGGRAIALNLPSGEEMQDHQTHESAYVVVAGGQVEIEHAGETASGGPGFTAHFEANERRAIRATEDARIILFLNPWPGAGHSRERAGGGPPDSR